MKYNSTNNEFLARHIGPRDTELAEMLQVVHAASLEELIDQTIPKSIRLSKDADLPLPLTEHDYLKELKCIAAKNKIFKTYIGLGYYNCITPSVIQRMIFENPGWYTQYTPYQAEISQGRLEALLNFQSMVIDLTGLEVANASLLDEGTAAAEAMTMLHRQRNRDKQKANANRFIVSGSVFPQTIDVLKTRSAPLGLDLLITDLSNYEFAEQDFGLLLQYPAADGSVEDYTELIAKAHTAGLLVAIAADLMSLVLLKSPAAMGADVALGSSQRFGVPLGYGGPHAAFFATRDEYKRQIPGRIIGVSVDRYGKKAYRMALQTREQHIRREKATSNICTAQALLAIMAGMYAVYHGSEGLQTIARRIHHLTVSLAESLQKIGVMVLNSGYFDTLHLRLPDGSVAALRKTAEGEKINYYYLPDSTISISLDETTTGEDLLNILSVFSEVLGQKSIPAVIAGEVRIPAGLLRQDQILTHPVFNSFHSETALMRYIKMLENKDLSLTSAMIPLGSCTMKLNPASALYPVSWPEFSQLHPFVPQNQAEGYQQVITELEHYLSVITGMAATSLQPNSGAQGEYAGLMVIRAYLRNRNEENRIVALIPSSAHGTNPASAVMAGMEVVIVNCRENGDVDLDDLRAKAEKHRENLAALMITYPSTHGVFEEAIRDMVKIIHDNGGQVYMDGANMNAQVGLTSPGEIGADICHLNLHKTFAIPHGGGGPGVGPICAAAHLAPFLPGHSLVTTGGVQAIPAVSATPYGSVSVALISHAYIRMLGQQGTKAATQMAILNANYIKSRLEPHYPVLFKGANGRVAHEMILDLRPFKAATHVEAEDVAKRLMDYGFHAPTMSWPVAGTIMVEPTESEPKEELDRFCAAMIAIHGEILEIAEGRADKVDNVLKNAPHTAEEAAGDQWSHSYPREKAVFPMAGNRANKFWPAVGRVDNTYGDRNLVCACPPIDAYRE